MRPIRLPLLLALCFIPLLSFAQDTLQRVVLSSKVLPWELNERWHYLPGDDPRRAAPAFPDTGWQVQRQYLDPQTAKFPGIGWWRRPVEIDSSLAGKPLAMIMEHGGASEVYIDGKLLHRFGRIGEHRAQDQRYTAGGQPFIFVLPAADTYLFAVRYADPDLRGLHGFSIVIRPANEAIAEDRGTVMSYTGISLFLVGLFLAFGLLHAVLFLYYRAARSNIWFAIFCFCLAVLFSLLCTTLTHSMWIIELYDVILPYVILTACFALSGFINSVFFKRRPWLRILIAASVPFIYISEAVLDYILVAAIIAVSIETVMTILFALYRKRPGARIVGAGMLLFALLLLYLFSQVILHGNTGVSLDSPETQRMLILAFIAILCMPLSMSVYLAWSFANMSRALQAQLDEVERLSVLARAQEEEKQRMLESRREELEAEVALRTEELRGQKQKSDDLLLNILPSEVAEELKERGQAAAKQYNDVTVLFTDFVDFTQRSEALTPAALVAEIDTCFRAFDEIIGRNGLEKIKTVGDAYIAVSGMPAANPDHAADVVRAGLEIRDFVEDRRRQHPESFGIRLGVHSGPVVAGIVGVKKFAYDIWGDAVNTAARMEQHSEPGQLNISETTYELVKGSFRCAYRGELEVKHKGRMHMYFVEGER
jgi:class 3 adenylate cyclase